MIKIIQLNYSYEIYKIEINNKSINFIENCHIYESKNILL